MVQIAAASPRTRQKKLEILRAASEVFREKGFSAAGMRDISDRLGIAVGKLYYYFRSKQDLLAFCQRHSLDLLQDVVGRVRERDLSADAALYLVIVGHLKALHRDVPGSLAHLEVESLAAEDQQPIRRQRRRYESSIRELIASGSASGVFLVRDAKVAASTILGALNWTVKWYQTDGEAEFEAFARAMAWQLVRGICREPNDFVEPESQEIREISRSHGVNDAE